MSKFEEDNAVEKRSNQGQYGEISSRKMTNIQMKEKKKPFARTGKLRKGKPSWRLLAS
jgi:hypothetical protein